MLSKIGMEIKTGKPQITNYEQSINLEVQGINLEVQNIGSTR